jgi:hypothetical protein
MNDYHGDEDEIDVSHVKYTNDHIDEAIILVLESMSSTFAGLINCADGFESNQWKSMAAIHCATILEQSKTKALLIAQQEYVIEYNERCAA